MNEWFATAVKKLLEMKWYTWAIVVAMLALGVTLIVTGRKKGNWNSRSLAAAAMCIALAFVLSAIRLYRMPAGGSITPLSMLPLIAFALAFGPAQGALVGCAYGILQLIQDPYIIHPAQVLLDYPLAFGALALAGFARRAPVPELFKLPLAVLLGAVGRCVMAVLSGVVFFADTLEEPLLLSSFVYNISYLGPDTALCFAMAFVPGVARIVKMLAGNGRSATRA